MIPECKVTDYFVMADDFCKYFDQMMEKYSIPDKNKRKYHRDGTMSKAQIMVILIMFHSFSYRYLKHFYLNHVYVHLRHLFPDVLSHNRFVELEKTVALPWLIAFSQRNHAVVWKELLITNLHYSKFI